MSDEENKKKEQKEQEEEKKEKELPPLGVNVVETIDTSEKLG